MALSLLLASCEEEGKPSYIPKPAVDVNVLSVGFHEAHVEIRSVNAEQTGYLCLESGHTADIQAEYILKTGVRDENPRVTI